MSKIKNDGLDQYGAGPLEQQQLGTAGIEGVNIVKCQHSTLLKDSELTKDWFTAATLHTNALRCWLNKKMPHQVCQRVIYRKHASSS